MFVTPACSSNGGTSDGAAINAAAEAVVSRCDSICLILGIANPRAGKIWGHGYCFQVFNKLKK
jgi:hypothetical protein